MKLKTYHSESVEAAVRLAGVELGDDAVFLGSRENPRGQGGNGYEVTFAVMETAAISAETETESQAGGGMRHPAPHPSQRGTRQPGTRPAPAGHNRLPRGPPQTPPGHLTHPRRRRESSAHTGKDTCRKIWKRTSSARRPGEAAQQDGTTRLATPPPPAGR